MDTFSISQMAHKNESGSTPRNEPSAVETNKDSTARKLAVMPKRKTEPKAKRGTRGEGSLYVRGRMYWFELGYGGVPHRASLGVSYTGKEFDRQLALDKKVEAVAAIRRGEQPKKFTPVSVQTMFENWMLKVETDCKPRTQEDYNSRWTAHLEPVFSKMMATQVTKQGVTEYLNKRAKEGAGLCARNREQRVLEMIFDHNRELIPADRFPTFPKMKSEKSHTHTGRITDADYAALGTGVEDPKLFWFKTLLVMTFKHGFRKSELLNAKVGYWNPTTSTFTLPAFTTKNDQSREVPIARDGAIYGMLQQLVAGRDKDDNLFHRNGKAVRDYRGLWDKLTAGMMNTAGKPVQVHDLRRSALSGMHAKGIGAKDAGTHLTADVFLRYVQPTDAEKQAKARKIEGD